MTMYRGRTTLGRIVQLGLWCRNASGTPTLPDTAPSARVYKEDGTLVETFKMPINDRYFVTGFFSFGLFLGTGLYAVGRYRVRYQYLLAGVARTDEDSFDVLDGGNGHGLGISSFYYRRPINNFLLIQSEGGRLLRRRSPHV